MTEHGRHIDFVQRPGSSPRARQRDRIEETEPPTVESRTTTPERWLKLPGLSDLEH
jgi:hypothetical protein